MFTANGDYLFTFFIPILRQKSVNKLYNQIKTWSNQNDAKKFYFVAHSFGTYILLQSLNKLIEEDHPIKIDKIILAGSVLNSNFDWDKLNEKRVFTIVNDCGTHDYILWLSNMFVPYLGMAGKIGFKWINSETSKNRYYNGGHSLFFENSDHSLSDHMEKNWLPILLNDTPPIDHNDRETTLIHHGVAEVVVSALGAVFYPIVIIGLLGYMLITIY